MKNAKQVVVIGAGIIGASIAWHLTKAGARVTVISESGGGGVATALGHEDAGRGSVLLVPVRGARHELAVAVASGDLEHGDGR